MTAELELETLEAAIEERRDQITTLGNVGALTGGTSQSSEQSLDELQSVRQKLLDRRSVLSTEANELISKLVERYPKLHAHVDDGIAVSVNGHIYRDNWSASIPPDAEVFLLPRLQGG